MAFPTWKPQRAHGAGVAEEATPAHPKLPWTSMRYRIRHAVRPWYAAAAVAVVGSAAHGASQWLIAAVSVVAAAVTGPVARWKLGRGTCSEELAAKRARHITYVVTAAGLWVSLAAAFGIGIWLVAALIAATALSAEPYWAYHRPRAVEQQPQAEPDEPRALIDEYAEVVLARWDELIATTNGGLPGTRLTNWRTINGGWAATIVADGILDPDKFGAAAGKIAGCYKVGVSAVTIELDVDNAGQALVMLQRQNPLRHAQMWAGLNSIDTTPPMATALIGTYADGTPVRSTVFRYGWGAPPELICGSTGTGKSELARLKLLIERYATHTLPDGSRQGLIASFVLDPQKGQSFAEFRRAIAWFGSDMDDAHTIADAFLREMFRRNEYIAGQKWVDSKGREREGSQPWDPRIHGPILSLTIDEAHQVLADRAFCAKLTELARMVRKVGMRIRLITQTPLLTDLGGSTPLRDMLAGGEVTVFRTANALSGRLAFNGRLPMDPKHLPEIPGMCYTLAGGGRAMRARMAYVPSDDSAGTTLYDYIYDDRNQPTGYPAILPVETLSAFGPEFDAWRDKLDGSPHPKSADAAADATPRGSAIRNRELVASAMQRMPDGPAPFDDICRAVENHQIKTRAVTTALNDLIKTGAAMKVSHGIYQLTQRSGK